MLFFMHSPMQRKYAAKVAHGERGEQWRRSFPCSIVKKYPEKI